LTAQVLHIPTATHNRHPIS